MTPARFTVRNPLRSCWTLLGFGALIAIVPLILLYVFGFSAKTTEEYACVLRMVEHSEDVIVMTGEPLKPGLFAWTSYFESGGGLRQGAFSTTLSGPRGRARIQAQFYRTPVGETLGIWLKKGHEEITIYDGNYPCD
ncbi:MAG TPA: hypothetical protein PLJ78_03955 [Anaerolineae bacterium]|nr:hypothetical protein [Anaerolineae bacterium]HQK13084.1 hypothetical protein [Anaerolineae bacterium]